LHLAHAAEIQRMPWRSSTHLLDAWHLHAHQHAMPKAASAPHRQHRHPPAALQHPRQCLHLPLHKPKQPPIQRTPWHANTHAKAGRTCTMRVRIMAGHLQPGWATSTTRHLKQGIRHMHSQQCADQPQCIAWPTLPCA
jgi:hypothetical protein